MANDDQNLFLSADTALTRPRSMPPIRQEVLNKSQIADERAMPEMAKEVKASEDSLKLDSLENEVTNRLLKLPRLSVPQFGTDLYRKRQLDFKPYLTVAAPGSAAPPPAGRDTTAGEPTPPAMSVLAQTPATSEAMRQLQVAATAGSYQFQRGISLPYMRKSLALSYEHVSLTKSLVAVTGAMAQMLEAKLEAIKLNTAAPESKKESLLDGLKRTVRQLALNKVGAFAIEKGTDLAKRGYAAVRPHLQDHLYDPMAESYREYRAGRKSAADVGKDLRDSVYGAYNKARGRADDLRDQFGNARRRSQTRWAPSGRVYDVDEHGTLPAPSYSAFGATPGVGSKYFPTTPPTAGAVSTGTTPRLPLPPSGGHLLLPGPASAHYPGDIARLNSFSYQKYLPQNQLVPTAHPPIIDAVADELEHHTSLISPLSPHHPAATHRAPASEAGKGECMDCCTDLIDRLDQIYGLMKNHFAKQEKLGADQLGVLQKEESHDEGPRVGSYQDHLRELERRRKERRDARRPEPFRRGRIGRAASATAGILGDLLSGNIGGLLEDALGHILGKAGGSAARMTGRLLKRGGGALLRGGGAVLRGGGRLLGRGATAAVGGLGSLAGSLFHRFSGRGLEMGFADAAHAAEGVAPKVASTALTVLPKAGLPLAEAAGKGILKAGTGTVLKSLAKKIPGIGALVGAGLAAKDLWDGDYLGAGLDAGSGLVSLVPGIGTAASTALDLIQLSRKMHGDTPDPNAKDLGGNPIRRDVPGSIPFKPEIPVAIDANGRPVDGRPLSAPPASPRSPASLIPVASPSPARATFASPGGGAGGLMQARLKAYGFPTSGGNLYIQKAITRFETTYFDSPAGFDPGNVYALVMDLDLDGNNDYLLKYFKSWSSQRFVPVITAYAQALQKIGATPDNLGALTPTQITMLLQAITSAGRAVAASAGNYIPTEDGYKAYYDTTASGSRIRSNTTPATSLFSPEQTANIAAGRNANAGLEARPTSGLWPNGVPGTTPAPSLFSPAQTANIAAGRNANAGLAPQPTSPLWPHGVPGGNRASPYMPPVGPSATAPIITAPPIITTIGTDYQVSGSSALDIMRARLKAYGFPPGTGIDDFATIRTITAFENSYLATIRGNLSTASIRQEDLASLIDALGMDSTNPKIRLYFKQWYDFRFAPVYVAYLRAIRNAGATPDDVSHLTSSQVVSVLSALTAAGQASNTTAKGYVPTEDGWRAYSDDKSGSGDMAKTPASAPPSPPNTPSDGRTPDPAQSEAIAKAINAGIVSSGGASVVPTTSPPSGPTIPTNDNRPASFQPSASPASGFTQAAAVLAGAGRGVGGGGGQGTPRSAPPGGGETPISGDNLGGLSSKYESSKAGGSAAIGWDSTGGTSYGSYQIAANTGTFNEFINWATKQGGAAAEAAKQLSAAGNPNGGKDGPVAQAWRDLSKKGVIGPLEQDFIKATHYDVAFKKLPPDVQKKINGSKALQQVLFSTAVAHGPGGAASIFNKVADAKDNDSAMIQKIYQERGQHYQSSTPQVRAAVQARYGREANDALQLASAEQGASNGISAPGGDGSPSGAPPKLAANANIAPRPQAIAAPIGDNKSTQAAPAGIAVASADNRSTHQGPSAFGAPTMVAEANTPAISGIPTPSSAPTMVPSSDTLTSGVVKATPPAPPLPEATPAPSTTTAQADTVPAVPKTMDEYNRQMSAFSDASALLKVIKGLENISSDIVSMHQTLSSGKHMDATNTLLKDHLDTTAQGTGGNNAPIVPVVINQAPQRTQMPQTTANNDLSFRKKSQNAGAADAA